MKECDIDKEIEKLRQYDIYDEEEIKSLKEEWKSVGFDSKFSELLALLSYWYQ